MDVNKVIAQMVFLVSEKSRIISPLPGILLAEIHLLPDHKVTVCRQLNELMRTLDEARYQTIVAVMDDDDDRYVRLISKGINKQNIDTERLMATQH